MILLGLSVVVLIPWLVWNIPLRPFWSAGFVAALAFVALDVDISQPPRVHALTWVALVWLAHGLSSIRFMAGMGLMLWWMTGLIWRMGLMVIHRETQGYWDPVWEGVVAVGVFALLHIL